MIHWQILKYGVPWDTFSGTEAEVQRECATLNRIFQAWQRARDKALYELAAQEKCFVTPPTDQVYTYGTQQQERAEGTKEGYEGGSQGNVGDLNRNVEEQES